MKKETIEFIINLLNNELDSEFIQENPNPKEVNYIKDLISATNDFINNFGQWTDKYTLKEKIEKLNI